MLLPLLLASISLVWLIEAKVPEGSRNQYLTSEEAYIAKRENFTTCEEFLNNTQLNISKVASQDWKVFYCWHPEQDMNYHVHFEIPSQSLVSRFKSALEWKLRPAVNWTAATFFMETSVDFSALYVQENRPGLFRVIPSVTFQVDTMPPYATLLYAIKMVEPGYLGIMNCKFRHAMALAPVDHVPPPKTAEAEAARFNYRSNEGYIPKEMPLLTLKPRPPFKANITDDPEIDDEEYDEESKDLLIF